MLPFLQDKKRFVAAVMGKRHDDGSIEIGNPDGSSMDGKLEAAAHLMGAFHSKNIQKLMEALEACFEVYDRDNEEPEQFDRGNIE